MASAKSILERMIAAMNRGETARKRDIDVCETAPKEETRRKEEPSSSARNSQL
jgi:hypothetical protein